MLSLAHTCVSHMYPVWKSLSDGLCDELYYMYMHYLCLFVFWSLSSHSKIFHSYGDVSIAGEGLQILIYARHSWLLGSEGSLACHTYCDTGHSFIMVISEDPWPRSCYRAFSSGAVTTYFYDIGLSIAAENRPSNLPLAEPTLDPTAPLPRSVFCLVV